jgi:CheY-like chemotaxis protein
MGKKILLVDDVELVTKSLSILLNKKGYDTVSAKTGGEAVQKAKEADFNLIICDVILPDIDGIETIKQIRAYLAESKKKSVPEILISGYTDRDKYEKAQRLEVAGYLFKPFDNEELLNLIKKTIA